MDAEKPRKKRRRRRIVSGVIVGVVALTLGGAGAALFNVTRPLSGEEGARDNPAYAVEQIWSGAPGVGLEVSRDESRVVQDHGWRTVNTVQNVSDPTVTVIAPEDSEKSNAAMVVLPGGGFGALAWDAEGIEVGEFLADRGITAFVLKYQVRTPTVGVAWSFLTRGMKDGMAPAREAAISDAEQAVRFVRENASRFGVDESRVGMTGFSAGAITTLGVLESEDPLSRPDLAVSVYGFDHNNNLRPDGTPLLIAAAHPDVTVEDAKSIEKVWMDDDAPVETHIFDSGDHGFGLGQPGTDSAKFAKLYSGWLQDQDFATG